MKVFVVLLCAIAVAQGSVRRVRQIGGGWGNPPTTPGWTTPPPTTAGWTTAPPTTAGWTTAPPTTAGWTTAPPTTAGWSTAPPTTAGWSTAPPTTAGWSTAPPTTAGWSTAPPTTAGWSTAPPSTQGWSAPPPPPSAGWGSPAASLSVIDLNAALAAAGSGWAAENHADNVQVIGGGGWGPNAELSISSSGESVLDQAGSILQVTSQDSENAASLNNVGVSQYAEANEGQVLNALGIDISNAQSGWAGVAGEGASAADAASSITVSGIAASLGMNKP